jgi:hypothetical protein
MAGGRALRASLSESMVASIAKSVRINEGDVPVSVELEKRVAAAPW